MTPCPSCHSTYARHDGRDCAACRVTPAALRRSVGGKLRLVVPMAGETCFAASARAGIRAGSFPPAPCAVVEPRRSGPPSLAETLARVSRLTRGAA